MADLTETQRKSLDDFRQITASEDVDQARTLLERSDWNLETAISSVYDDHDQDPQAEDLSRGSDVVHEPLLGGGAGSASSRSSRSGTSRGGGASPSTGFGRIFSQPFSSPSSPFRIILLPFYWALKLGVSLFAFIFTKLFRIRPNVPNFSFNLDFFGFSRPSDVGRGRDHHLTPHEASVATIQQLESDLERMTSPNGFSAHATATAEPSSSTSKRPGKSSGQPSASAATSPALPQFHVGSYDSAVAQCKAKLLPLLVVLFSEEHGAHQDFLRALSHPNIVRGLQEEDVMVWVGNVRYADAYAASDTLEAATFPFYAFITPAAPSTPVNGARKPLVFSRLEGSPLSTTSAESVVTHLTSVFLPRIRPTLSRLQREQQHREAERQMRADQDAAYAQAARADVARIRAKQAAAERERQEAERRQQEVHEADRRAAWRGWLKTTLPAEPLGGAGARVSVKLPDGRTLVRRFDATQTTMLDVYHWVECSALPSHEDGGAVLQQSKDKYTVDFKLLQLFPKRVLDQSTSLEEAGLAKGGNLVVEGLKLPSEGDSDEEEEEEEEEEE